MTERDCDILVAGGGLSGLLAGAVLAGRGFEVVCCDSRNGPASGADNRVTALLGPSVDIVREALDWESFEAHAKPLKVMRIVDAGRLSGAVSREFRADMIGQPCFGHSVPNRVLAAALMKRITGLPNAEILNGASVEGLLSRLSDATVRLADGRRLRSRLVIAADGRNSRLRGLAGLNARRFGLGQKALSFDVIHSIAHRGETVEIHNTGGPFTLVPIKNIDGLSASSVVWIEAGPEAERLTLLDDEEFEAEASRRSLGLRGALSLRGPRLVWPVYGQIANRFAAHRLALIGEAAHVVPPVGAQGLNMTLADIAALAGAVAGDPGDPGSQSNLDRYNRSRHASAFIRLAAVMGLDWVSAGSSEPIRSLRRSGLSALASAPAARNLLMRFGMRPDAPAGMRSWACIRKEFL